MSGSGAPYEQAPLQRMRAAHGSRRSNLIPKGYNGYAEEPGRILREGLHYMKLTKENPRG